MPHRSRLYRRLETVIAVVLVIYGVRAVLPIENAVVTNEVSKIAFGLVIAAPGIWLLFAQSSRARAKALLTSVGIYIALTSFGLLVNWEQFAAGSASFGLAAVGIILYSGARAEECADG